MNLGATVARFVVLSALLTSVSASGTLIMAFCNGNALYLGSDSLQTTTDYSYTNHVQKIRAVGTNCCVSLSGFSRWTSQVQGRTREFDFLDQMEGALRKTESSRRPLPAITNAVMEFEKWYRKCCGKAVAGGTTNSYGPVFTFWGYDRRLNRFCGLGWACSGTNRGVFQETYDSRGHAGRLFLQGESDFLSAFISNPNNFPTVTLSDRSKQTWDRVALYEAVSEEELVAEMVELFALHKLHAATFSPHSGHIAEPYVIWRLRRDGAKMLGAFRPDKGGD
jgi:hypothetical protein